MKTATENDDTNEEAVSKNTKYIIVNDSTIHKPPHIVDISRRLLCIEYPGIVENIDRMLQTLGGLRTIEMTVGNHNRRLELQYRFQDIFSKSCWGDRDLRSGVLVKITVQEPRQDEPGSSKQSQQTQPIYSYEVIGVTSITFKFFRLCDFQYLPLTSTKKQETHDSPTQNIYKKIIPKTLPSFEWFQSPESCSMPLFLPPPIFTKFNSSKENKLYYKRYKYYEKVMPHYAAKLKKEAESKKPKQRNVISYSRLSRKANSIFVNFNLKDAAPTEPNKEALSVIKKKGLSKEPLEMLKKLFDERPIWSKSALLVTSGMANDRLKMLLPAVAYHFPSGPWRVMWCRFGYDPRTNPTSRIYQTFDYRVRQSDGLKVKVQAKRNYSSSVLHYRAGPINMDKFSLKDCQPTEKVSLRKMVTEDHYILKPNMIPPARQMFYQYCDLQLPEIQDMLNRLPEVPKHAKCDYKDGWLPNGFHDQCREIANNYMKVTVRRMLREEKQHRDEEMNELLEKETQVTEPEPERPPQKQSTMEASSNTIIIEDEGSEDSESDFGDINNSGDDEDGPNDEDDIDLETVDEINKIIGNMSEPQEEKDSDEELDPELINLYHKLIDTKSSTDIAK